MAERAPDFLVIDDDPIALRLAREVIERAGHRAHVLGDPIYLGTVVGERIDVALIDVRMPRVSGPVVVDALKRAMADSLPLIVLYSGMPEAELRAIAEGSGADDWMAKPLTPEAVEVLARKAHPIDV